MSAEGVLCQLEDLNEFERARNRVLATEMIPRGIYQFSRPASAIPLEHLADPRHPRYRKPITFRRAMYIRYDAEKETHMFLALCRQSKLFVGLFLIDVPSGRPLCQLESVCPEGQIPA